MGKEGDILNRMISFLKLNGLSVVYAFILFLHSELSVNVYRIERITGWRHLNKAIDIAVLLIYVGFSILGYLLTDKRLARSGWKYVTCLLWIPYYFLLIRAFAAMYPLTDPQEAPLGGVGILLIGAFILFPFYIALLNFIAGARAATA